MVSTRKVTVNRDIFINLPYTAFVIMGIYALGTAISSLLSSYIVLPGNIIGMGILFGCLQMKIVKFERIQETGEFILKHLSLFFVPFGVSIVKYYPLIATNIVQIIVILLVSTILAISLSARIVEEAGD